LQNIPKFHLEADIIHLQNRSLLLKIWACLYFSALFPFLGSGCTFYICLVFGDVIFDELWVVTDIDIRVNKVLVLFLMTLKSTRPSFLPNLNTGLLIFKVTPV
jgi:hypothetical protein